MHVHPCRMFFSGPSSFMVVATAQVVVCLQRKVALLKTGLNFSGMATRFFSLGNKNFLVEAGVVLKYLGGFGRGESIPCVREP